MIKDILKKLAGQSFSSDTKSVSVSTSPVALPGAVENKITPSGSPPVAVGMPPLKLPRRVIEAPVKFPGSHISGLQDGGLQILAQVTPKGDECRVTANSEILPDISWYFGSVPSEDESPLAARVFAGDPDVESVLISGPTVTISRKSKFNKDWKPLAKSVGGAIRTHVASGKKAIADALLAKRLSDDEIRLKLQAVIDSEVNPGVAGHGGQVSLVSIKNNAATLNMGGGCQGCSSAAVTLKGGIEKSFRAAIPTLGAIHDATDHSAGTNPFFS